MWIRSALDRENNASDDKRDIQASFRRERSSYLDQEFCQRAGIQSPSPLLNFWAHDSIAQPATTLEGIFQIDGFVFLSNIIHLEVVSLACGAYVGRRLWSNYYCLSQTKISKSIFGIWIGQTHFIWTFLITEPFTYALNLRFSLHES